MRQRAAYCMAGSPTRALERAAKAERDRTASRARDSSVGFGLYLHASVPEAAAKKAVVAFQGLTAPAKPLAVAMDLGPQFSFVVPTADQLEKMRAAVGLGK